MNNDNFPYGHPLTEAEMAASNEDYLREQREEQKRKARIAWANSDRVNPPEYWLDPPPEDYHTETGSHNPYPNFQQNWTAP